MTLLLKMTGTPRCCECPTCVGDQTFAVVNMLMTTSVGASSPCLMRVQCIIMHSPVVTLDHHVLAHAVRCLHGPTFVLQTDTHKSIRFHLGAVVCRAATFTFHGQSIAGEQPFVAGYSTAPPVRHTPPCAPSTAWPHVKDLTDVENDDPLNRGH